MYNMLKKKQLTVITGPPQGASADKQGGKTNAAIDDIFNKIAPWYARIDVTKDISRVKKQHVINCVITNNSLVESCAWKSRLNNKKNRNNKSINMYQLASDRKAEYHKMSDFTSLLTSASVEDISDINFVNGLIMCNHRTRINDLGDLINSLSLSPHRLIEYKINIFLDEADIRTNALNINELLKQIKKNDIYEPSIVNELIIITATPGDYINSLRAEYKDIIDLDNVNYMFSALKKEDFEKYRSVLKNDCVSIEDSATSLSTIKQVMEEHVLPDEDCSPKVVFAPAERYVSTHEDVQKYFETLHYDILVINGKTKSFFIYDREKCNYTETSLIDFNTMYLNKKSELRDTLRQYRKMYPDNDIAITGLMCVTRGVTFNTDGFTFTHAIYTQSAELNEMIHLCSRSAGDIDYTKRHTVFLSDEVKTYIEDYLIVMEQVCLGQLEITPTTFKLNKRVGIKKKRNNEKFKIAWHVPILFHLNSCEYSAYDISKFTTHMEKEKVIKDIVSGHDEYKYYLDDHTNVLITAPVLESSYKKNITDLIKRVNNGKPSSQGIKLKQRFDDNWCAFIDIRGNNIIIVKNTGSKIIKD